MPLSVTSGRCRYCGCSESDPCSSCRAVHDGCSWSDPDRTVCSAPACTKQWGVEKPPAVGRGKSVKRAPWEIEELRKEERSQRRRHGRARKGDRAA